MAVGGCGVLAIVVALRLVGSQGSALALYYTVTAIVAGGLAGLFLLAFLVRRAGRVAALLGIGANLIFTAWATLTMNGGKVVNLGRWNYSWSEYTIGAVGNVLLFAVGYVASLWVPADGTSGPTVWDWLTTGRRLEVETMIGEVR
jgi:SSS family solute:Na+ symporter